MVVGEPSDSARTNDTASLLTWGFRFYESHPLLPAHQAISKAKIWLGQQSKVTIGINQALSATVAKGQWTNQKPEFIIKPDLKAPIQEGEIIGKVQVTTQDGTIISQEDLIALESVKRGGFFRRLWDHIALFFYHLVA